jgi:alpha-L-fucosidase
MFDTQQTDYKVTADQTVLFLLKNPKANIAKEIFEAFRKKDFMTGRLFFQARLASS